MKKIIIASICAILLISSTGCINKVNTLEEVSKSVISALNNEDLKVIESFAHPNKGIRFSPYATVNLDNDIVLKSDEIGRAYLDDQKYLWGYYDGSGEPMEHTFKQYYSDFIYSSDFENAEKIGINEIIGTGNSLNNLEKAYPNAEFIEYYFSGFDPQYGGMDWGSLRLVFEKYQGEYKIIGIIHDQWTI